MAIIESEVIPSGVLSIPTHAFHATEQGVGEPRYPRGREMRSYRVRLPSPAPDDLRVELELGAEGEAVWASVVELDLTVEGGSVDEAFTAIIRMMRDWLEYLRDEEPDLADKLKPQAHYVPLLDAPEFSWFKSIRFAEWAV